MSLSLSSLLSRSIIYGSLLLLPYNSLLINCQYGFKQLPESYYDTIAGLATPPPPNNYNTVINATAGDEDIMKFATRILQPTQIYLLKTQFSVGPSFGPLSYSRYEVSGSGSFWTTNAGIGAIYIDLRPVAADKPTGYAGNPNGYNPSDYPSVGLQANSNGTITYSLTYYNLHDDLEIVHNHGQLGHWWTDGVPYFTANPMNSGESQTYSYTINPSINSGSYFIHSHYGFNSVQGLSAPLIIQSLVDWSYPLASKLNDPNINDIVMFLEDYCLVYTNADDVEEPGGKADYHVIHDPSVCQNPYLAYRAVFGEWNNDKGPTFLGYGTSGDSAQGWKPDGEGELHKCEPPALAPEYGFSFFLANHRTYDDPQMIYAAVGTSVRLRVISGARQTNFLVELPVALTDAQVIATDGHLIVPTLLPSFQTGGHNSTNNVWVGIAQRVDIFFTMPSTPGVYPIIAFEEAPAPSESGNPNLAPFEISYSAGIIIYSTIATPSGANTLIAQSVPGIGMLSVHPDYHINQELAFHAYISETNDPSNNLAWTKNYENTVTGANNNNVLSLSGYNGIFGMNFEPNIQFPPMIPLTTPKLIQPYNFFGQQPIMVKQNDRVCINLVNYNWDTHPIHFHGHSFQVVAINGNPTNNGAVRDTVLVPAGGCQNVTICFNANQPAGGAHSLHCHMAIHEMAGMYTYIQYENYAPITTIQPVSTTLTAASALMSKPPAPGPNDNSLIAGLDAGTIIFAILFAIMTVIAIVLAIKLRSHVYQQQSHTSV